MARRPDSFISFVEQRLEDLDMTVLAFERATGDRFRHLTDGRQRPPLATLHKWADALHLDRAQRLELLRLADAAHGGGTICGWIVTELEQINKEANERDRLIAKLSLEVERMKGGK